MISHGPPFVPRISRPAALVFCAALAVRFGFLALYLYHHGGKSASTSGDMGFYEGWAQRILAGQWTDHHAFYGLPGYAYVLAGLYAVAGVHPGIIFAVQSALDALTAITIFIILREILSREIGNGSYADGRSFPFFFPALASAAWIAFLPAETYTLILMPTVWMICAFWFCVWRFMTLRKAGVCRPWIVLGLLIGVVCTLVATVLFLLPLAFAAIWMTVAVDLPLGNRWRRQALAAGILMASVFAGASPVWIHNFFVAHEPVMLSAHSGINFWIGNYPGANGYPKIPEGLPGDQAGLLKASIRQAEQAAGHPLTRAEVSKYWSKKAWDQIHQDPWRWIRLLGVKVRNFWNAYSYDDLTIIPFFREQGDLWPGLGFGIVAALGLAGMALGLSSNPATRWVSAAVLLQMLALLPVFITERYRMAAAPGLIILGSYALCRLWRSSLQRRWKALALQSGVALAASAIVFLPKVEVPLGMEPYNLAISELDAEQFGLAKRHLDEAEAVAPNDPRLLFAFGNFWLSQGDLKRTNSYYQRAFERDPRNADLLTNLGVVALLEKHPEAAQKYLGDAAAIDPEDADRWYLLSRAREASGQTEGAREAIERALRINAQRADYKELRDRLSTVQAH